ncbi:hypothetical protein LPTSP3_g29870 [Leptospira kobayashii]|uniref:PF04305 family protein n=1 Tax=Leptospira kobayashii TaxID=1917830 RepID=A0ABM7UM02_9LEPT|nr:DUF455 family protein [Leptospira kobayashii]BDA80057.1 hypothetical protein LPTSP3_g29870 [Leptospira kobayashii]
MKLSDYAKHLLLSPNLEDKLISPLKVWEEEIELVPIRMEKPVREDRLSFSDKKVKIPRLEHLNQTSAKGLTLHHFANHELMAIELFAWAILAFPDAPIHVKYGFIKTIEEEQSHLKLYIKRMSDFGIGFGDIPLNYIFWKQIPKLQSLEEFTAVLSISFEGANLDYSQVYAKAFHHFGDFETAEIMMRIFEDEIKHVKRGMRVFQNGIPEGKSDWDYYLSLIQFPFTPRRAKGYYFIPETRRMAGMSESFIQSLGDYTDEYTSRVNHRILERFSLDETVWKKSDLPKTHLSG